MTDPHSIKIDNHEELTLREQISVFSNYTVNLLISVSQKVGLVLIVFGVVLKTIVK